MGDSVYFLCACGFSVSWRADIILVGVVVSALGLDFNSGGCCDSGL